MDPTSSGEIELDSLPDDSIRRDGGLNTPSRILSETLLQGHRMLPDVVVDPGRGPRPDVVEGFGVGHAVLLSQLAVPRQEELLDVIAVGGRVIVTQQGQALVLPGELGAEPGAVASAGPLRLVGAV